MEDNTHTSKQAYVRQPHPSQEVLQYGTGTIPNGLLHVHVENCTDTVDLCI